MDEDLEIAAADPASADAATCLRGYFADLEPRFGQSLDYRDYPLPQGAEMEPPRGAFLVARLDGRPVGCGALSTHSEGIGYVSRMWMHESARGRGLGSRILAELERRARHFGLRRIRLYTHASLSEAQVLYRRKGYREVEPFYQDAPFADVFFEKDLSV